MAADEAVISLAHHYWETFTLMLRETVQRFVEGRVFLALGDHDYGEVWRHLSYIAVRFEPALAGHLLVKEEQIEGMPAQHFHGIIGIAGPFHPVSLASQAHTVWFG